MSNLKTLAFLLVLLTLSVGFAYGNGFETPVVHGGIILEAQFFPGSSTKAPWPMHTTTNKYSVRKAAVSVSGKLNKIDYDIEFGTATCQPGGGFRLMDAEIFYNVNENLRIGAIQGHILRGFELVDECSDILTAEKPNFSKIWNPAHPFGASMQANFGLPGDMEIEAELAYVNGKKSSLEKEYGINLGLFLYTPVPGLGFCGYYNQVKEDFSYTENYEDGYRANFGIDYSYGGMLLRSEYYMLKGYTDFYQDVDYKDLEMEAYFLQAGYRYETGWNELENITPYLMYEISDRAKNAGEDMEYSYIKGGVIFGIDKNTKLKIHYEEPIETPDSRPTESGVFISRLQVSF